MKGFRAFFKLVPGSRRPPTGPLTTAEEADADELRQENLAKETDQIEREEAEARQEPDPSSE